MMCKEVRDAQCSLRNRAEKELEVEGDGGESFGEARDPRYGLFVGGGGAVTQAL